MMDQRGQSLIEVTVAIGLSVIVLGAITVVTLIGLRNSQFAQNEASATKLAQQGLEEIRSLRDQNQNGSVCVSASVYSWTQLWGYNCTVSGSSKCIFKLESSPGKFCSLHSGSTANPFLELSPPAPAETINNKFTRIITIDDYSANQKKITVTVSWSDAGGSHSTSLVTILANY